MSSTAPIQPQGSPSASDQSAQGSAGEPGLPGAAAAAPVGPATSPLTPGAVVDALDKAARRGKLSGFRAVPDGFTLEVFGAPFDERLECTVRAAGAGGTRIEPTLKRALKMPIIFAIVLALSVEPGRYFTDQLIPGEWGWIDTRWWYYPITILPIPFMWRTLSRRSKAAAAEHAGEQWAKVLALTQGTPAPGGAATGPPGPAGAP